MTIKQIKRKIIDSNNIRLIKNSVFFDKEYYLNINKDVSKAGLDPALHYYYDGWREGRNPSLKFDNNLYLEQDDKIKINPLLHYEKYGKRSHKYKTFEIDARKKASTLINDFFKESTPLKAMAVSKLTCHRLNVVFNGFDSGCFFGGKATALILGILFAQKYNYKLRIISQDPEENIFYQFLDLFDLRYDGDVEFFATKTNQYLEVDQKDDFLCTMWSNADSVLNTPVITGKIFYIMQEVETFFYDHGDYHLRCSNVLTDSRIIPIVNSKLLYDYLINHGYDNVKNNGIYFEPAFSNKLLKPGKDSFNKKKKYKLLFYARPSHQRNIFYFGLDNLNEAFLRGVLNPNEWIVYTVGDESIPPFQFDANVEVKELGVMSWKDYCTFLSTIDLCYSMIYTPHPSYPPFDSLMSGAVCVTNKFANKQDLNNYSNNVITSELNKESMIKALNLGAELAKNSKQRQDNYSNSNINNDWNTAFKDVLKFMEKKLSD